MQSWPHKDPDEILDYQFNWAQADGGRLETGETIIASYFSVEEGDVVIDSDTFIPTGLTTVWLSGGTLGTSSVIRNRIVTSEDRTYDKSARLRIRRH